MEQDLGGLGVIPVMWRGWTRSDEVDRGPQSVARLRVTSHYKTGSEYSLPRGAEGRGNGGVFWESALEHGKSSSRNVLSTHEELLSCDVHVGGDRRATFGEHSFRPRHVSACVP